MKKILLISALSAMTLSGFVEMAGATEPMEQYARSSSQSIDDDITALNELLNTPNKPRSIQTIEQQINAIRQRHKLLPIDIGDAPRGLVSRIDSFIRDTQKILSEKQRGISGDTTRSNDGASRQAFDKVGNTYYSGATAQSASVLPEATKPPSDLWAAVTKCYFSSKFDVDGKDLRHLKLVEELLKLKDELQQISSDDKTKPFIGELQGLLAKLEIRFFENDNGDVVEIINNCFEITPDKHFENKQVENLRDKLKKLKRILSSNDPFELKTIHTDGKWQQLAEQKEILRKAYELCQLLERMDKKDFVSISGYCSEMEKNDTEAWNKLHQYGEADQKFVRTKEDEYLSRPWVQQNAVEQAVALVEAASKEMGTIEENSVELYVTKDGFSLIPSNE